jgi:hypothetical protein
MHSAQMIATVIKTIALARINRRDFPILPPTTTVLQKFSRLLTWENLSTEFKFSF